jgi:hypothetical protein
LEEQSEAKGISPTFSKSKVKRIGLFQKFGKTKQSEVNRGREAGLRETKLILEKFGK